MTQDYFGNATGELPAKGNPEIAIRVEEMIKLKSQPDVVLVDARPANEFAGDHDVWLRKGHIPGAISFHWARLVGKKTPTDSKSMKT